MTRTLLLAAGLAGLAACGRAPADAPATTSAATPTGDAVAAIRALPAGQRTAVFLRAIRDAGRDCQGVVKAVEVTAAASPPTDEPPGRPTWQATCEGGTQWLVALRPDGTATVTNRADLREREPG